MQYCYLQQIQLKLQLEKISTVATRQLSTRQQLLLLPDSWGPDSSQPRIAICNNSPDVALFHLNRVIRIYPSWKGKTENICIFSGSIWKASTQSLLVKTRSFHCQPLGRARSGRHCWWESHNGGTGWLRCEPFFLKLLFSPEAVHCARNMVSLLCVVLTESSDSALYKENFSRGILLSGLREQLAHTIPC